MINKLMGYFNESYQPAGKNPYRLMALSFLGVMSVGTALLMLPIATVDGRGTNLVDAAFTAVSCLVGTNTSANLLKKPFFLGVVSKESRLVITRCCTRC